MLSNEIVILSALVVVLIPVPPPTTNVSVNKSTVVVVRSSPLTFKLVATLTEPAAVKRPSAATVNVGIAVAEP